MAATASGKDKVLRWTRLYVGGYDLSGDARTFGELAHRHDEALTWGINETVRNYQRNRRQTGISGVQVLLNDSATRAFAQLKQVAATTTSIQISICMGGGGVPATPDPAYFLPGVQLTDPAGFEDNIAVLQTDFMPDAAQYNAQSGISWGYTIQGPGSQSATFNSSSHDGIAQTTNGWHANFHVITSSGGSWAFVLEDSADDSAWATLGTFTADGSAVTSEHLSGTGTVDQYVRLTGTRSSGSVSVVCVFARN